MEKKELATIDNKEIKNIEDLKLIVDPNTLVRVMRKVGDPSMDGENMPTIYNMLNVLYSNPLAKYDGNNDKGFSQRQDSVKTIFNNRVKSLIYNLSVNAANRLLTTMLADPALNTLIDEYNVKEGDSRNMGRNYGMGENIMQKFKWAINDNAHNYDYDYGSRNNRNIFDLMYVLEDSSVFLNLATITDFTIACLTGAVNNFYSDIIKDKMLPEVSYVAITNAVSDILDYAVYVFCLIKYEAICVYNNAYTSTDKPSSITNNAQELLEWMYNYDFEHHQRVVQATVALNTEEKVHELIEEETK